MLVIEVSVLQPVSKQASGPGLVNLKQVRGLVQPERVHQWSPEHHRSVYVGPFVRPPARLDPDCRVEFNHDLARAREGGGRDGNIVSAVFDSHDVNVDVLKRF